MLAQKIFARVTLLQRFSGLIIDFKISECNNTPTCEQKDAEAAFVEPMEKVLYGDFFNGVTLVTYNGEMA